MACVGTSHIFPQLKLSLTAKEKTNYYNFAAVRKIYPYWIPFFAKKESSAVSAKLVSNFPANIYLFKVNKRNIRKRCEKCSKLTIKTLERCYWCRSGVSFVNCEHISHLFLVFLLLTLSKYILVGLILHSNKLQACYNSIS